MEQVLDTEYNASVSFLWSAVAFLTWTTIYFLLCFLNARRSYEWHCRQVTVIHGLSVTALSAWCGFVQGPWPFTHPGGPITSLQRITVCVCLGYFVFDILWCIYFKTEGGMMFVHHILSITGSVVVLYLGVSGTEFIAAIFGSEATNPFLQTRWFLRQTGRHKSWLGEINDLIFMLLFGYLRIGVGSNLIYWYLQHPRPLIFAKIGGVLFYLIGVIWFVQIVLYARKKYVLMYRSWNKGKSVLIDTDASPHAVNKDNNRNKDDTKQHKKKDDNQNGVVTNGYKYTKKLKDT